MMGYSTDPDGHFNRMLEDLPPIIELSDIDFDGTRTPNNAGSSALRLHNGLLALDASVKMLTLAKKNAQSSITAYDMKPFIGC